MIILKTTSPNSRKVSRTELKLPTPETCTYTAHNHSLVIIPNRVHKNGHVLSLGQTDWRNYRQLLF